jgi:CxC2 like cysteine cluster associated with KDZ transposases
MWIEDQQVCGNCTSNKIAIWRCLDCSLSSPMCRQCMRHFHKHSPFHRIECWTGSFYRRASLWEVGNYILVKHHKGRVICDSLKCQIDWLESLELRRDDEEQYKLKGMGPCPCPCPRPCFRPGATNLTEPDTAMDIDIEPEELSFPEPATENAPDMENECDENDEEYLENGDDNGGEADLEGFDAYLGPARTEDETNAANINMDGNMQGDPEAAERPRSDALNNTYVRIVHTNGIHHLAMVSCHCDGQDVVLDLVSSRLLPASFKRIRTLFTVQLMDYFRLCNLELKASAYQFYQLIRRLTLPFGQAEIINVYHEFRRMSRIWRWIKKLKWAGYGHNKKDPRKPDAGSLANFCPTCPQPTKNLPENWKEDRNRSVYGVALLADGNFKADHVKQKSNNDVWLWDGGGMAPNRDQYYTYLANAIEKYTVSPHSLADEIAVL